MNQCEIDEVIKFCQSIDELITYDPGSSSLEVLEPLRLEMCDRLKMFDYEGAETVAYRLLLHWMGLHEEAKKLG